MLARHERARSRPLTPPGASCYGWGMQRPSTRLGRVVVVVVVLAGASCRRNVDAAPPETPAPAAGPPTAATTPAASAASAPARAQIPAHRVSMAIPSGWSQHGEDGWVVVRDPAGTAGFMLFAWDDASRSPELLHRAEAEFAAEMPIGVGKLVTFASGLRTMMTLGETTRADGVAVKTLMMSGGSPLGRGGIGAFAFWRADCTAEQLGVLQAALDSLASP